MNKTILKSVAVAGFLLVTTNLQAAQSGEELFMSKCSVCHKTKKPSDMSTLVAPPIPGVAMHVKMKYPKKEEAMAFIESYVLNPRRDKAVCMPQRIQRFGLMPSQKGKVSEAELKKIAEYIVDNYPNQNFVRMERKQEAMMMRKKGGAKASNPFLIHKGLPHLSKLLMQRWDDPALGLTAEQKAKLLPIRKETMAGVRKYKPQVMRLEKEIRQAALSGTDPKELEKKVAELSRLKKDLTMIHLNCIYQTREVLTPAQWKQLLPMKNQMGQGRAKACGAKN